MHAIPGQLPVQFDRKFHLGGYEGGHAQVLFRSGRTGYHRGEHLKYDSVTDVLFKNVAALAVAENYYRLEISLAGEVEKIEFCRFLKCEIGERNLYVLHGEESAGYVLAGAMYWIDDEAGSTGERSVLYGESDRAKGIEVMRA